MAPHVGSQLYDYLRSRVCLRPWGYDPMINAWRFHFSGVPDDRRAREVLGYEARWPIDWRAVRRL